LLAFDSKNNYNKITSIGGEIRFRFSTDDKKVVYLKVGDVCYVLDKPVEIKMRQVGKMKVLINNETVGC